MLVSLTQILEVARDRNHAVPSINVFGYEDGRAIVDAAERLGAPVILAANKDMVEFMPLPLLAATLRTLGEAVSVPVCVHLDHTYDLDIIYQAVDEGFTSVMYDGSQLPLEENIANTKKAVDRAHAAGVSVEGEIGSVPYSEGRDHILEIPTDPQEAVRLADESGLDALAVSVGNIHRLKTPTASIDFERLAQILEVVNKPLVIHGTSGIAEPDLKKLVNMGIRKFNVGTVLRQAFGNSVRQQLERDPLLFDRLTIMKHAMPQVQKGAERVLQVLGFVPE